MHRQLHPHRGLLQKVCMGTSVVSAAAEAARVTVLMGRHDQALQERKMLQRTSSQTALNVVSSCLTQVQRLCAYL